MSNPHDLGRTVSTRQTVTALEGQVSRARPQPERSRSSSTTAEHERS
jgi:hypothetical protein